MTYGGDKLFHLPAEAPTQLWQSLHWRIPSKLQASHDTHFIAEEIVVF